MSVIGPRPGLWNQDILTAERDKYGANDVKPGLTGWAQINGRDELEIPDKAKLDGDYVHNMGLKITKAIEEKVAVAKSRMSGKTKICCTRYGNVMCSRGSVIPLWIDQIKQGNPITLTEPSMTRFIMSLEEAVDLVLFAFEHGENGDLLIQKAPACTIQTQAEAVCELFGGKKEDIKIIGIRHGEKMYETLLTNEECAKAVDLGNFYRVPADNRGLNYDKYFKDGDAERNTLTEFDSNNTKLLTVEETKAKIASLSYIQEELAKMEN